MAERSGLRFSLLVGVTLAILRKVTKRGRNVIVIPEAKPADSVVPVAKVLGSLQLPPRLWPNPIEEVQASATVPAIDFEGLPGPAISSLARSLLCDGEGKTNFANLKLTCTRLCQEANNAVTHLRSEHFVVDDARLAQISAFGRVESLELKLGEYNPAVLTAALEASRHLTELSLARVGDATALCECLSRKTLLRKLSLENSALPSLNFLSSLDSLVSFSLVESSSSEPKFCYWNNLSTLARLDIDQSDQIANTNMTSLSSISGLEYLHLGLTNFEEADLLTLNASNAQLSLRFYTMRSIQKLSVLERLLTLERLSLVYCDLHHLPVPLSHLRCLKYFHISTQSFCREDFENLNALTGQLQSVELELTSVSNEIVMCLFSSDLPLVTLNLYTDVFELKNPLNNCPHLKTFHVSATGDVRSDVFSTLGYFSQLETLVLTQCLYSIAGLENLHTSCPRLKSFSIGACPMTDHDLEHISRISTLERLELLCCVGLTNIAPLNLLQFLKHLRIEQCLQLERNLEAVLSEPILMRLESLHLYFSAAHDPDLYTHLFNDLMRNSSGLVLRTEMATS